MISSLIRNTLYVILLYVKVQDVILCFSVDRSSVIVYLMLSRFVNSPVS